MQNFKVKIYTRLDKKLEEEWHSLEKKKNFYFFQSFSYISELTKSYDIGKFYFATAYRENIPILIVPLEIKVIKGIKILQWLGTSQSDYCCPIVLQDNIFEKFDFISIWKEILNQIDNFDIVFLNKQPEFIEQLSNPFVTFLSNKNYSSVYQIKLKETEADFIDSIENKKFVSEFARTRKKLLQKKKFSFENLQVSSNKDKFRDIIKQKILFLNKKKTNHIFDKKFLNLYEKLLSSNPEKFNLSVIKINDEIVAANFGIIENGRFYYYLPVIFSEKYNSFSPGKLLIYELIKWSIQNKLYKFDFGIGEEKYKKYWCNKTLRLFRHLNFKGIKGFLIYFLLNIYLKFK